VQVCQIGQTTRYIGWARPVDSKTLKICLLDEPLPHWDTKFGTPLWRGIAQTSDGRRRNGRDRQPTEAQTFWP